MSVDPPSYSPGPEPVVAAGAAKLTPPGPSRAERLNPPSAPLQGKFTISYPLRSFASTPHNVACIAFLLGGLWSLGLASAVGVFSGKHLIWSPAADAASLPPQGLVNALFSPFLGFYLASWAFFHLLEFVVTSMYNPGKLSVSSYLLDNGSQYHIAHALGITEFILEEAFLPAEWRKYKHLGGMALLGLVLVLGGQLFRSCAMISASSNFSHIVATTKLPSHQLVKTGIYAWSRHPSYAGFAWWAIGTQASPVAHDVRPVLLGNPLCALSFSVTIISFFSDRIATEERMLIKFFGDEYIKYRKEVPTRILFVS